MTQKKLSIYDSFLKAQEKKLHHLKASELKYLKKVIFDLLKAHREVRTR